MAVALGAERVDYVDGNPRRLDIAKQLRASPLPVSDWASLTAGLTGY